jgi:hypothetical protein
MMVVVVMVVVVVVVVVTAVGHSKWVLLIGMAYTDSYIQMYSCIIFEHEMY